MRAWWGNGNAGPGAVSPTHGAALSPLPLCGFGACDPTAIARPRTRRRARYWRAEQIAREGHRPHKAHSSREVFRLRRSLTKAYIRHDWLIGLAVNVTVCTYAQLKLDRPHTARGSDAPADHGTILISWSGLIGNTRELMNQHGRGLNLLPGSRFSRCRSGQFGQGLPSKPPGRQRVPNSLPPSHHYISPSRLLQPDLT